MERTFPNDVYYLQALFVIFSLVVNYEAMQLKVNTSQLRDNSTIIYTCTKLSGNSNRNNVTIK